MFSKKTEKTVERTRDILLILYLDAKTLTIDYG